MLLHNQTVPVVIQHHHWWHCVCRGLRKDKNEELQSRREHRYPDARACQSSQRQTTTGTRRQVSVLILIKPEAWYLPRNFTCLACKIFHFKMDHIDYFGMLTCPAGNFTCLFPLGNGICWLLTRLDINSLTPLQNGRHFADAFLGRAFIHITDVCSRGSNLHCHRLFRYWLGTSKAPIQTDYRHYPNHSLH